MPRGAKAPVQEATVNLDFLPIGRSFQPIKDLVLLPGNPRVITEPQFISLCASIKRDPRYLFSRAPLVADGPEGQAGRIVYAGNMRVRALEHLFSHDWVVPPGHAEYARKKGYVGEWTPGTIPIDVDDIDKDLAYERAVQDNNSWGQWNDAELAEMIAQMPDDFLEVSGFDQKVLDDLLATVGSGTDTDGANGTESGEIGPNTAARLQVYQNATIRQLVLYFPKDEYDKMLDLLDWLRSHFNSETNTEAVTKALQEYRDAQDTSGEESQDDDGGGAS